MLWGFVLAAMMMVWLGAAGFAADPTASPLSDPLTQVRIDEHLGHFVPLDTVFTDSAGAQHRLGDYFNHGRPVILTLVYYECPMLCTMILNGLTESLKNVKLEPGEDFDIVTVSIDPRETPALAATKKAAYLKEYNRKGADAAWHWNVGADPQIHRLADSLGYQYAWDEQSHQFAHQAAIFVLTPKGEIARYLYGIEFSPRDLKLALLEAGRGYTTSTIDKIILFCYHYDPQARGYSLYAWRLVQGGALITVAIVGSLLAIMWRRERKVMKSSKSAPPQGVTPNPDKI